MYTKEVKGEAAIMRGGSPPLREGGWTIAASRCGGQPAASYRRSGVSAHFRFKKSWSLHL